MATLTEVDDRSRDNRNEIISLKAVVDAILANTVPLEWLDVNSTGDLTGKYLYGLPTGDRASINDGNKIYGWKSTVADPTSDSDFETPFGPSN